MKYCDRCDATYSDRISFCFKDGSALFARRSALDLPSLDGPLGSAPAPTETDSESLLMRAQTTEEFLQVPTRRAGIEPINPLVEAPPTAWKEPSLAPAPTDPIGSVSFDDTSGFFSEPVGTTPEKPQVAPVKGAKPPKKRGSKPSAALIGGSVVALLAAGLLFTMTATDSERPAQPQDAAIISEIAPIDAAQDVPEPPSIEAVAPAVDPIEEEIGLTEETGQLVAEAVSPDAALLLDEPATENIADVVAPEIPVQVTAPSTVTKTTKKAKKRVRQTTKKRPTPAVSEDNPWGVTDSTNTATTGSLSITSTPSGATIWIDDKKRGITPLRVDLSFNTYNVRSELAGHKTQNIVVPIKTSAPSPIPFSMQAILKVGKVQVSSQKYNGKELKMDGKSVGVIPLQIREVEEGRHTFSVDGDSTTVDIVFNQNLTFSLPL